MTWDQIITFIIIALLLCLYFRADYQRWELKRQLGKAIANNATLAHLVNEKRAEALELRRAMAHPSFAGYRPTDEVVSELHPCQTCDGLQSNTHFTLYPTHVKL